MGGWVEKGASEGRKSPSEPLNLRVRLKGEEKLESTERGESYETGRRADVCVSDLVLKVRKYFSKENYWSAFSDVKVISVGRFAHTRHRS